MKNLKRSHPQRISSVDNKKQVSVIKCFICNQMYYSKIQFDDHMQQHEQKLIKNTPNDIRRKTCQQFKNKKYSMNKSSTISNDIDTKFKIIIKDQDHANNQCQDQQIYLNKDQGKYAEEVLRQSILLIKKIQALTSESLPSQHQQKKQKSQQRLSNSQQYLPQIQQQQLIQTYLSNKAITLQMICKTKFNNQYLNNYQVQLISITQLLQLTGGNRPQEKKLGEIKESIFNKIIQEIKSISQDKAKLSPLKKEKGRQELNDKQFEIVENTQISYCTECLMNIDCDEECYEQKQNNPNEHGKIKYHIECFPQINGKI